MGMGEKASQRIARHSHDDIRPGHALKSVDDPSRGSGGEPAICVGFDESLKFIHVEDACGRIPDLADISVAFRTKAAAGTMYKPPNLGSTLTSRYRFR